MVSWFLRVLCLKIKKLWGIAGLKNGLLYKSHRFIVEAMGLVYEGLYLALGIITYLVKG